MRHQVNSKLQLSGVSIPHGSPLLPSRGNPRKLHAADGQPHCVGVTVEIFTDRERNSDPAALDLRSVRTTDETPWATKPTYLALIAGISATAEIQAPKSIGTRVSGVFTASCPCVYFSGKD